MSPLFTSQARRLGMVSGVVSVALTLVYVVVLGVGLLTLPAPDQPITGALFVALEALILCLMPALVMLFVAIRAWASAGTQPYGTAALVFMALVAGVTCGMHFVILTVSHHPAVARLEAAPFLFSFTWPSVAYALDVLAWDVFFPLAVLCAAVVFQGSPLQVWIRRLLVLSGVLAFAGLSGVVTGDMQLRNVGIVGYAVVFPVAAALVALEFRRARVQPVA